MVTTPRQELSNRVKDQLIWDNRVRASDVDVTVQDGTAILTGRVPSYRAKIAATEDAWSVMGITNVDNRLRVQYPPMITAPTDSEIMSSVNSSLTLDPDIDASKIDVMVSEGIVTLRGTVDSLWKKFQAASDAYSSVGVIDVINEIAVVVTDRPVDEMIARNIEAAFDRNFNINPDNITVTVANGIVTLSGTVPNWSSWRSAYNTAVYTAGVTDVIDELTISYI